MARRCFTNLLSLSEELKFAGAEVHLVNDSPDYLPLKEVFEEFRSDFELAEFHVHENDRNIGWLRTCNKQAELAVGMEQNILLVNSDVEIFPGALTEMISVLEADPRIIAVNPRSNNATICNFPTSIDASDVSAKDCGPYAELAKAVLPRWNLVPTVVGFCLLVKWQFLMEHGLFDEIYEMGYQEENDLAMRARMYGYRVAQANHAYVWHEGSRSFREQVATPQLRDQRNARILQRRFPEYTILKDRYLRGEFRQVESLAEQLAFEENWLLDFRILTDRINGTGIAGIAFLRALIGFADSPRKFTVICSKAALETYGLRNLPQIKIVFQPDLSARYSVGIRWGQPFSILDAMPVSMQSAFSCVVFQDSISEDLLETSSNATEHVWDQTLPLFDKIVGISEFTKEVLCGRRPELGGKVEVIHLGMGPQDDHESTGSNFELGEEVLVVGNHYRHKMIPETVNALKTFDDTVLINVLGGPGLCSQPGFRFFESGRLNKTEIDDLYERAKIVIFPSVYEGFGLPVIDALSRGRRLIVRRSSLMDELLEFFPPDARSQIHFYDFSSELPSVLREALTRTGKPSDWKPNRTWRDMAFEFELMAARGIRNFNFASKLEMVRLGRLISNNSGGIYSPRLSGDPRDKLPSQLIGERVAIYVEKAARFKLVRMLGKWLLGPFLKNNNKPV